MKPQIISHSELAQYVPQDWTGANESDINPIGDMVLILPDVGAEFAGKTSKIMLPNAIKDRNSNAAETGVIVAMGDGAFKWSADRGSAFEGAKPKVGDRVLFARYSGTIFKGADGKQYRVMSDNCVAATTGSATLGDQE